MFASWHAASSARAEVAILGAGPAAASVALSLLQAVPAPKVVIVASPGASGQRIGESLPPGSEGVLRQLGVLRRFAAQHHRPAFSSAAAWGGPEPVSNDFFFSPHQRGWQIDRAAFDAMLLEAAIDAGASLCRGHWVDAVFDTDARQWVLGVRLGDGGRRSLRADFVVDATGRRASFAQRCGGAAITVDDALVAAVRFAQAPTSRTYRRHSADTAGALVEACRDGWWYSAPLPGGGWVAAAMSDAATARQRGLAQAASWNAALADAPCTRQRLNAWGAAAGDVHVVSARSQSLTRCTGLHWLAAGDAASAVDPLSSQGISRALRGGVLAAYAVRNHFGGQPEGLLRYAACMAADHRQCLTTRREFHGREMRWAEAPFWSAARGSHPRSSTIVAKPNDA